MPIVFDLTQTLAYEQGEAKGEAKAMRANITKMLTRGKLKPTQIADILEVPLELVLEIEKSTNKPT